MPVRQDSEEPGDIGNVPSRRNPPEGVRILGDNPPAAEEYYLDAPSVQPSSRYSPAHGVEHFQRQGTYEPSSGRSVSSTRSPAPELSGPPAQASTRRSPGACAILATTFSLLMLSCALLAFATIQGGVDGLGKLTGIIPSFPSFGPVTTPTVTIDTSRPVVIERIRSLSRLETVHFQLEKVVSGKSAGPLPDFLTSDRILLVAYGEVVGGIDLSKLRENDITVDGTSVRIRLPRAEILHSRLDNDRTYVYDRQTGVFNKPDPNLETQLRQAAEDEIVAAAEEGGILQKAQENAEEVVRTLVEGLGYTDIEFTEAP